MKIFSRIILFAVVGAVIAAGVYFGIRAFSGGKAVVRYQTSAAVRGDVSSFVSATGTLEPEELVNVGAQVSGKIVSFGKDEQGKTIDYGSPVKEGMVLARIDEALYDAEKRSAQAQKLLAEAEILSATAGIRQAEAKLSYAKSNWERAQELFPKKAMAKNDYDNAQSEVRSAQASKLVCDAALEQAKARLASAEASLDKAARNLDYCIISSPVDGVIIDRRVSVGQTVVSNMSASSIFLIAKDLKKMQVWVSVNEADIGSIKPGMPVLFTVDAFPGETFSGKVHKIRLNATMSQNVVTYVVEVSAENPDGKLLPYLTASVKFILAQRKNVLTVPNAALRFRPDPAQLPPELANVKAGAGERLVWVLTEKGPQPVKVRTGLNDGVVSEILSGDLAEGAQVITGATVSMTVEKAPANGADAGSPFLPKPPQRNNKK